MRDTTDQPTHRLVSVAAVDEVRLYSAEAANRTAAVALLERAAAEGRLTLDPGIRRSVARISGRAALYARLTHERVEAL